MDLGSEAPSRPTPCSPPTERPFSFPPAAAWEEGSGDENALVIHSQVEEEEHRCSACGESFGQPLGLLRHQKQQHAGERAFVCAECGRGFGLKHNLIIHQRIHTGEKPFGCGVCGKRFSLKQNLLTHQRVHGGGHGGGGGGGDDNEGSFSCPACGKGFRERRTLLAHQKGDCSSAGEGRQAALPRRRLRTRGRPRPTAGGGESPAQRPLRARRQGKAHRNGEHAEGFGHRGALTGHHRPERPPPGDEGRRGPLGQSEAPRSPPQRLRSGEGPFRCLTCGKSFAQKSSLAAHRRSHLGPETLS